MLIKSNRVRDQARKDPPTCSIGRRSCSPREPTYIARLNKLKNLENREFHEEKITGPDKNVDVVVGIFNRVNSGGTALSKGDLAPAKSARSGRRRDRSCATI